MHRVKTSHLFFLSYHLLQPSALIFGKILGRMGADKGKRLKVSKEDSDDVDAELVLAVEKLQDVQDELDKIDEEASEKYLEVIRKYNEICRPVYNRRNEIIKSIPEFWLAALLNHPVLHDLVSEEDHKILKYLDSINVEDHKDATSGYTIAFIFNKNPYFEDIKLTKAFTYLDDGTVQITNTNIKWKEGMGTATGVNRQRGSKYPLANSSFIGWLNETELESVVNSESQEEVAEIIKKDLWPDPLKYFDNADEEDSDEDKEDEDKEDFDEEEQNEGHVDKDEDYEDEQDVGPDDYED